MHAFSSVFTRQVSVCSIRLSRLLSMVFTLVEHPPLSSSVGWVSQKVYETTSFHPGGGRYYGLPTFALCNRNVGRTIGSLPTIHSVLPFLETLRIPILIRRLFKEPHSVWLPGPGQSVLYLQPCCKELRPRQQPRSCFCKLPMRALIVTCERLLLAEKAF